MLILRVTWIIHQKKVVLVNAITENVAMCLDKK